MSDCIFCKIVRGEIPARKVYEDEHIVAFHDINPIRPVHVLVIPKQHVVSLMEVDAGHQAVLGHMLVKANEIARGQGLDEGFRAIINSGRIGHQEVYHLHLHIIGGPEPLGSMLKRQ